MKSLYTDIAWVGRGRQQRYGMAPFQGLVGFPLVYDHYKHTPIEIVSEFQVNPLRAVLLISGWTIHDIINSKPIALMVRTMWKAKKQIEAEILERHEWAYFEWLWWLKRMGCPV